MNVFGSPLNFNTRVLQASRGLIVLFRAYITCLGVLPLLYFFLLFIYLGGGSLKRKRRATIRSIALERNINISNFLGIIELLFLHCQ